MRALTFLFFSGVIATFSFGSTQLYRGFYTQNDLLELIGDNHEVEIATGHDVEVAGTWDFTTMNKDFSIIIKGNARLSFTTQNANIVLLTSKNLIVENTSKEDALIQTKSIDIVRVTVGGNKR